MIFNLTSDVGKVFALDSDSRTGTHLPISVKEREKAIAGKTLYYVITNWTTMSRKVKR